MSVNSSIEWTDATWNPITGCDKVSPGCKNCYAERFSERWRGIDGHPFEQGFDLRFWHERLEMPLKWKKPKRIFVNSMSDIFHKDVPLEFIQLIFRTMKDAHWHTFQLLTKRHQRMYDLRNKIYWPKNVWMGVSVEDKKRITRIKALRAVPANVRFLSIEPLLEDLGKLNLAWMDWVIVGGESGPGSRLMDYEWVTSIRDQAIKQKVPFFFKQWGGVHKKALGRVLDGRTWDEFPN